jgi:hypothetical protein
VGEDVKRSEIIAVNILSVIVVAAAVLVVVGSGMGWWQL